MWFWRHQLPRAAPPYRPDLGCFRIVITSPTTARSIQRRQQPAPTSDHRPRFRPSDTHPRCRYVNHHPLHASRLNAFPELSPPSPTPPRFPAANECLALPPPLQAYNSVFNSDPNVPRLIGNFPLLPLRTKTRGPAFTLPPVALPANESPDPDSESYDILDEVLALFRANTFFRNFEIQGPADRLLVYGIWFVSDCLSRIKPTADARTAGKDVMNLALDVNFAIPGDPGWPLNQVRLRPLILSSVVVCGVGFYVMVSMLTGASCRCTSLLAIGRTRSCSASTCRRCARSWRCGYSRGCSRRTATGGRASGG